MQLVYLASPYTDENAISRIRRSEGAQAICAYFAAQPELHLTFFSPIAHWAPIEREYGLQVEFQYWKEADFFLINKAAQFWIIPFNGWRDSHGVAQELEFALEKNKNIFFVQQYHNDHEWALYLEPFQSALKIHELEPVAVQQQVKERLAFEV